MPRWQRVLLPGDVVAGRGGRRSPRDWAIDVVMAGLAVLVGGLVLADTWSQHSEPGLVVDVVLGAAAWLVLWWRRQHPTGVALAIAFLITYGSLYPFNFTIPADSEGWAMRLLADRKLRTR